MSVVARRIAASPARSAANVWSLIADMLAPSEGEARKELLNVLGVACSVIASEILADVPLVVYGSGPRLRIYCVYGEDAISQDGVNESALAFCPTDGDWHLSLPCPEEDLSWIQAELNAKSTRITAREASEAVPEAAATQSASVAAAINKEEFFRP